MDFDLVHWCASVSLCINRIFFFKDPFKQHKSRIPCVALEGSCVVEEVSVQKLLLNDTQGPVSDRDKGLEKWTR